VACKLALATPAVQLQDIKCMDMSKFEPERLITDIPEGSVVLVVISTYEGGTPPDAASWFCR
jgi:tRNA wybutosine-synthesizing protein 1